MDEKDILGTIAGLKRFWEPRNRKFLEWYETLVMVDSLASKGLESYVSNEPQTFYDMAHYLLTRGDLSHYISLESESAIELDKRARVNRGCQYMWNNIDRERRSGGSMSYLDELGFFLLVLGWYSSIISFDQETGLVKAQVWNPYDTFPYFADGKLMACVHSYKITEDEALVKAEHNNWNYKGRQDSRISDRPNVVLDDFWKFEGDEWYNAIFFDSKVVDGWVKREATKLLVSPVSGFPDKGSLSAKGVDWRALTGRSIFEVNESVSLAFNKWKTEVSQVLRDTVQPIMQEFSGSPVATPEQLRERGALFHYAPGEAGLQRVPPAAIPIELQAHLMEIRRELQKGSFNDAVWGMVEGQPGYSLSMMASSSANQILYPYMDAKHFVFSEGDSFWLSNLKTSKRVFNIKGKLIEKLKPTDIPDDVNMIVESDVATPKDWLERSTIANYLKDHVDKATILGEVLKFTDPQAILKRKELDEILTSPEAMTLKKIAGFRAHAKYLEFHGDFDQAKTFLKMADAMEAQFGAPAPGQGMPQTMGNVEAQREAVAPSARPRVSPGVAPPEAVSGFGPQTLRNMIGRGKVLRG